MAFYSINLVVVLGLVSIHWQVLGPNLTILVGGINGILALFFGSDAAHKVIIAKNCESLAHAQNSLDDKDAPPVKS